MLDKVFPKVLSEFNDFEKNDISLRFILYDNYIYCFLFLKSAVGRTLKLQADVVLIASRTEFR